MFDQLLRADKAYYDGNPIMSDQEYDALRKLCKDKQPNHPYFSRVGAAVTGTKVRHRSFVGSQKKVSTQEEFLRWKGGNETICQMKYDGYTLVAMYVAGKLVDVTTRGDGEVGETVYLNAKKIKSIPHFLPVPYTGEVRGEGIISKKSFEEISEEYSNARNAVAMLRSKDAVQSELVDFIAFECEGEFKTETEMLEKLSRFGFTLPTSGESFEALAAIRDDFPYEVDGVVYKYNEPAKRFVDGCRVDQCCVKFEVDSGETRITGWSADVGSTGKITPVFQLSPVQIGGVVITSATGHNFSQTSFLDVGVGDRVIISRRGGVIPYLEEVVSRAERTEKIEPMEYCPKCGHPTSHVGAFLMCMNFECDAARLARLHNWIGKLEIMGLGDAIVQEMFDWFGILDPINLYMDGLQFLPEMMLSNRRLGESSARKIREEIEHSRNITLDRFFGALSIPLLGRTKAKKIIDHLDIRTAEEFIDLGEAVVRTVPGFAAKSASAIMNELKKRKRSIIALASLMNFVKEEKPYVPEDGKLFGETICFTGAAEAGSREEMQAKAREAGGIVVESVTKKTTILVLGHLPKPSSKVKAAEKHGTKIMSEAEFLHFLE